MEPVKEKHVPLNNAKYLLISKPWTIDESELSWTSPGGTVKGDLCSGGHDLSVDIRENSPDGTFIAKIPVNGNPLTAEIHLNVTGPDVEWFRMEGKVIKLNVLPNKPLDRELLTIPFLFAMISCTDIVSTDQIDYRLMVQVLNENDNSPIFLEESVQALNVSEMTPVGEVLIRLQAQDKDGDGLIYMINKASNDAEFFRIDLPSSGKVLLSQPLDYEVKKQLDLQVYAMEMNTEERYNTTAKIAISVLDGDDQYPRFLPCNFLLHKKTRICVNPVYRGNVTEAKLPYHALQLSPGPLLAKDGDKGLQTPVAYSILAGDDNGRFEVNNITGAIMMRWPVRSFVKTPMFTLTVMASQVDDSTKYTVTTVLIRILAPNRYRPRFKTIEYEGFIQEQPNSLTLGRNPNIVYSLAHQSNHTQLFQVTQEGLLIARADRLHAFEKYMLQIVGTDKESGDMISTRVKVEVLHSSQPVPSGITKKNSKFSVKEMGLMGGVAAISLLFLIFALVLLIHHGREWNRHRRHRDVVAIEQNSNVHLRSLKRFQMDKTSKSVSSYSNLTYINKGYGIGKEESNNECDTSNQGRISNTLQELTLVREPESVDKLVFANGKQMQFTDYKSFCIKTNAMAKESHTNISHQYLECRNEQHRVFGDCSLRIDLQLPRGVESESGKDHMKKDVQYDNKAAVSDFIEETIHEDGGHLETMKGEIKCSVSVTEGDWSANLAAESNHSTSTTEGLENQVTAEQKQQMFSPENKFSMTTLKGEAQVLHSEKPGSMNSNVITEDTIGTDYLPAIEQPATTEHPKLPAADMPLGDPLVAQRLISVSIENPVKADYQVPVEHPLMVQHSVEEASQVSTDCLVEMNGPVAVEHKTIMEQTLPDGIAVGNTAAMGTEGIVIHCPTTGVIIEIREDEMEGTTARETSTETPIEGLAAGVIKCSIAEVAEMRLTTGLVTEGQSEGHRVAEDEAAERLAVIDTEEEAPTYG
ncbi:uncharacterized protein cdhr5-rs isoform X3 [Hemitrygon akajei]|uniref:uncharacterized protein cdhr5-rs isoform X3 n=1 Tax=Hemitrygon akajei TaxID=2704970 RepID=UPI003BFA14A2